MTYSLTIGSSKQLGTVKKETVTADAQLFEMPIPRASAAATELMDLFGVIKTVDLEGTFIDGQGSMTIKNFCDQFIDDATGIIKGTQIEGTYTSDTFTTSIPVIVKSFKYSYDEGEPTIIRYTLSLQEGKVT